MKLNLNKNTYNLSQVESVKTLPLNPISHLSSLISKAFGTSLFTLTSTILLLSFIFGNGKVWGQATQFAYNGINQTYTVPAGVCQVMVHMWGAGGGGGNQNASSVGGGGAYVTGILDVTPGESLTIVVGQRGAYNNNTDGTNYGGGRASGGDLSGWGGGRSAICRGTPTTLANNIVVAGGGGGAGRSSANNSLAGAGGGGGNTTGQQGGTRVNQVGGGGGSTSAGGSGGTGPAGNGAAGTALTGGRGGTGTRRGGGGGGGYYGGGGGGSASGTNSSNDNGAGGGGGSSLTSNLSNSSASAAGSGQTQGCATCQTTYNNNEYGRGGALTSAGQDGRVVIIPITYAPTMGTFTLNGVSADINACPGSTVNVSHTGWNRQNGTLAHWVGVENPAGSGWVTEWAILNNGNQNLNMYSFTVPSNLSPGQRIVVHSNAYCGSNWGPGVTRYVTVQSTANDPGAVSVPTSICVGSATNITNVTAATTGTPASTGPNYYFYYRGGPSNVNYTMYDGPTSNSSSALPSAVINTPGQWYISRNSEFGCAGQTNNTTTLDLPITVNADATAGTIQNTNNVQITDGSTLSICAGSTITANNLVSPTAGSGSLGVVWYCGELISGAPGTGTYGNWVSSGAPSISDWPLSNNLLNAVGGVQGSGTSLTNYNPQSDFPGKTNFMFIRRAYNSNCRVCAVSCKDQSFFLNLNALPTTGSIGADQTICSGATPTAFTSTANGTGTGTISYEWQTNASGSYATIGSANLSTYQAPSLSSTTSYQRRTVSTNGSLVCYSAYTTPVQISVVALPSAGTVTSNPETGPFCSGTSVSASVSGGSGGTGTIADVIEYNNGSGWLTYSSAVTASAGTIQFRTYRTATGSGCNTSSTNTAAALTVTACPLITPSVSSLPAFGACTGIASSEQSFTVSGTDLGANNIVITAPTGFQVSTSSGSGFGSSVSLSPTGGSLASTTIYVVMLSASTPTGATISLASTGAVTQNVAVSGTVTQNLSSVTISGTDNQSICSNTSGTQLSVTAESNGGPVTSRQWGYRITSGGSVTPISGATGTTYTPAGADLPTGVSLIVCTSTPTCGAAVVSNEITVTESGLPTADAGPNQPNVLMGSTIQLAGSATNQSSISWSANVPGTFNNNTLLNATWTPSNILYTGPVTFTLTANATSPCSGNTQSTMTATIGVNTICPGGTGSVTVAGGTGGAAVGATNTYAVSLDGGATWSSATPNGSNVISINTTGATGPTIQLRATRSTIFPSCSAQQVYTLWNVYPQSSAGTLSGTQGICVSGTTTFTSNGDAGGTWSSSDAAVATVNSSGVVTGVASGTATITYTVDPLAPCTTASTATRTVTVTAPPSAGTLSGNQSVCSTGTTTFSSTVTGGSWSSDNTAVATIDATTGVITPVAAGTATMTYTVTGTGGCSNATATRTVTVTAPPSAGTLSGNQSICSTGTTTFSSTVTGGSWGSDNTAVATIDATTGVITPVAAGTATMTYTVTGTGGCSNAMATRTVTINICANSWTGNTNSSWNESGNWASGVPGSGQDITIPSGRPNYPTLELNPSVDDLTIQSGASLTIPDGQHITVTGVLTNNGTVTVQNGGALVQGTSSTLAGTGTYSVKRILPTADRFHYIGSPVNNAGASSFGIVPSVFNGGNGSQLIPQSTCDPAALEVGSPWCNLLELRENAAVLSNCSQSLWHVKSAGTLENGRGYAAMAYGSSTQNLSFNGTVNNGTVTFAGLGNSGPVPPAPPTLIDPFNGGTLIYRGWHMVSNPYPSPIIFGPGNAALTGMDFDAQVQVWNSALNTWVPSVSNAILPVAQGFQIRNSGTSALDFTVTNAMRTPTSATFFDTPWEQYLTTTLENATHNMQTVIFFHEDATDGYDGKLEANRLFGGTQVPVIYTLAANGMEHMAFNGYAPLYNETKTVEMGVYDGNAPGPYSLRFQDLNTLTNTTVVLEDTKLNTFTPINEGYVYNFATAAGDETNRFRVHFNMLDDTQIGTQTQTLFSVFPNPAEDMINIAFADAEQGYTLQLRNLNGKTLRANEVPAGTQNMKVSLSEFASGVYLLEVRSASGERNVVKLIRK